MATEEEIAAVGTPLQAKISPSLDVQRVQNATYYSRRNLETWIANSERAWLDEDREKRLEAQHCRWCFYARGSRLAGQAFTDRDCESCKETQHYPSTATNPLCKPCAKKLNLCVECCADISLADRRKLERKLPPDHVGGKRISARTSAKRKVFR